MYQILWILKLELDSPGFFFNFVKSGKKKKRFWVYGIGGLSGKKGRDGDLTDEDKKEMTMC